MSKPKTLETIMAQQVTVLYLNTMKNNREFQEAPYLDLDWFKKHFAAIAHKHEIFHGDGENREARERYNIYFRLVRERLSKTIKRLAREQRRRRVARINPPQQLGLPGVSAAKH